MTNAFISNNDGKPAVNTPGTPTFSPLPQFGRAVKTGVEGGSPFAMPVGAELKPGFAKTDKPEGREEFRFASKDYAFAPMGDKDSTTSFLS